MLRAVSQKADVDPFAKLIHDLCVAAGAKCGAWCDHGAPKATTSVKGAVQTSSRRPNLTVREAEAMGARRPLTLAEAHRMRGH
jgi:hypothetical protein